MNEFDAGERDAGSGFRHEAEHGSYPMFDTATILFDSVVHVFAGANGDGFSTPPQPVLRITLHDGHAIGLAPIKSDLLWPDMPGQSLVQKPFC